MKNPEVSDDQQVRWKFSEAEFDEARWVLTVAGTQVAIERKPLEVLRALLRRAGEIVTKDELIETVWSGRIVVEGALSNAVGKLRKALRDEKQRTLITVARVGYRLEGKVECKILSRSRAPGALREGASVPRRPHWILSNALDRGAEPSVWLARHEKTGAMRVFKFGADDLRLRSLKRESTIARLLHETLGERPGYVRVHDWDFDDRPFHIESEYGGEDLERWAEARGGLSTIPLHERIAWFVEAADAVADAHEVGVLHKDLKPANLLVTGDEKQWHARVIDFGSGRLLEPGRIEALGITNIDVSMTQESDAGSLAGTLRYLAPELLVGQPATIKSDLYALGVILYQIVVGDLRRPFAAGWENGIDPLLREDIEMAAHGNPDLRFDSVRALTRRLRSLSERRTSQRKATASFARRTTILPATILLIVGSVMVAFSGLAYILAPWERFLPWDGRDQFMEALGVAGLLFFALAAHRLWKAKRLTSTRTYP